MSCSVISNACLHVTPKLWRDLLIFAVIFITMAGTMLHLSNSSRVGTKKHSSICSLCVGEAKVTHFRWPYTYVTLPAFYIAQFIAFSLRTQRPGSNPGVPKVNRRRCCLKQNGQPRLNYVDQTHLVLWLVASWYCKQICPDVHRHQRIEPSNNADKLS